MVTILSTLIEETEEQDFKYLGSWVCLKERDINVRKALAWQALNELKNIWKSNIADKFKL